MRPKSKTRWLEISVRVNEEASEAIAELFNRYGEGRAVIDTVPIGSRGLSSTSGSITRVKIYLPINRSVHKQQKAIEDRLSLMRKEHDISEVETRQVAEDDWLEAWKRGYTLQRIGRRLVIVPSWEQYAARQDEVVVIMDPGMAFGTGLHPTTRLCLIALERYCRREDQVLDAGTGSGIQAIMALKLGASHVTAFDTEEVAAEVARRNMILNGVSDRVELHTGTLNDLRSQIRPVHLIVGNILAFTIIEMIPGLKEKLLPGGHFIGGGILDEYAGEVENALTAKGLEVVDRFYEEEWVSIVARKADA